MGRKYVIKDQQAIHFVTFTVVNWIDLFIRDDYKFNLITESLSSNIKYYNLRLMKMLASFILIFLLSSINFANSTEHYIRLPDSLPVEVDAGVFINKVYNINSIDETFQVDGYFISKWKDERAGYLPNKELNNPLIYENERVDKLTTDELWTPSFLFVNVLETRLIASKRVKIFPDGSIEYEERFFATCSSKMDFINFPFDTQCYKIKIEPFSLDTTILRVKAMETKISKDTSHFLGDGWVLKGVETSMQVEPYEILKNNDTSVNTEYLFFDQLNVKITAKRLSGYYVWQVMFPILIIIFSSFIIFWIEEFGVQISVGFTLMLTVVAFNFYSTNILPKLNYNTFLEYLIIIGYIFIILGIVAVVVNHKLKENKGQEKPICLQKHFRYLFPLAYLITMVILCINLFT